MKPSLSLKTVFTDSWLSVKTNFRFFVLLTLLLCGILAVRSLILNLFPGQSPAYFLVNLLFSLFLSALILGLLNLSLNCIKTRTASFSDLTAKLPSYWLYLLTSIYYSLIVLAGLILFLIPGFIWAIRYQFFGYVIVDQGLKPKAALAKSKELTKGYVGKLFLFNLILLGLNTLGLFTLVFGLLITIPLSLLATAKVYELLSGSAPTLLKTSPNPIAPTSIFPSGANSGQITNVWKRYRQS